jgi:hypothetical protein
MGWAGLVMILVGCVVLDKATTYPGYAALLPTFLSIFPGRAGMTAVGSPSIRLGLTV